MIARAIRDAVRHGAELREQLGWSRAAWRVERDIDDIVRGGRPLLVGPWLSEVGYETLYWIPFLRWVKAAFRLEPSNVIAVSRGGVAAWYDGIASRYIDVWEDFDPAEFTARTAERGAAKQLETTAFDREIVAAVERREGTRVGVLHPSLMYRLFSLFWSGQLPLGFLDSHTRFAPMAPPRIVDPGLLPSEYVAVKFYSARSLPDTPAIRRTLGAFVEQLAERTTVVLLDTGLVLDEHADYAFASRGRVISAKAWMTPANNLGVQTQIIAGARAFAGTCGSVAWLAPMLGIDTAAVFVDSKWLHVHLGVALRACHRAGAGRFSPVDLRALDALGMSPSPQALSLETESGSVTP